jgi:23S rRNA pseudouridine2605 synthase
VSGNKVTATDQFTVIVYNKPRGELVTKKDPQKRKTIYDSLSKNYKHFIPVGRLDYASEGLLLLTDASRVATALMTSKMERVYRIKIKGAVTEGMKIAMGEGLELDDASAGAHEYAQEGPMSFAPFYAYQIQKDQGDYSILKVAIGEGQNRELRRFFAHFGAEIVDLKRLSFGGIELNNLPTGKVRFLERAEYANLRDFLETVEKAEKMKENDKKGKAKALGKPDRKPVEEVKKVTKREFVKEKKTKPQNEVFGTNKYKPKSDNKFKK